MEKYVYRLITPIKSSDKKIYAKDIEDAYKQIETKHPNRSFELDSNEEVTK